MSLVFRPVVTFPVRCSAPVFFRPAVPSIREVAPFFSLFDESFAQLEQAARHAQRAHQFKRPFNPKFDVKEAKESYLLEGELPGFDAKDISIEFLDDGHTLQIKGQYVKETKNDSAPAAQDTKAVESTDTRAKAVEAAPAPATEQVTSETSSVKSHQATVEDDAEEPANASAVTSTTTTEPAQAQSQETTSTAETSKAAEQQTQEVAAKQEQQQSEKPKQWISERYSGSFSRSFKFPSKVNQEAVTASLKDGILAITLPFARKPESRRIQIE